MSDDDIFIWDGKEPLHEINFLNHVHDIRGFCLKDRFGGCTAPRRSRGVETAIPSNVEWFDEAVPVSAVLYPGPSGAVAALWFIDDGPTYSLVVTAMPEAIPIPYRTMAAMLHAAADDFNLRADEMDAGSRG